MIRCVLDSSGFKRDKLQPLVKTVVNLGVTKKKWGEKGVGFLPSFGISSSSVALRPVNWALVSVLPGFRDISVFRS